MSLAHRFVSPSSRHAEAAPAPAARRLAVAAAATALGAAGSVVGLAAPAAAAEATDVALAEVEVVITDEGVVVGGVLVPAHDGLIVEPQSFSQCFSGNVCVWDADSYAGTFFQTASTSATNTGIGTARSYANRSTKAARIYTGTGGSGSSTCLDPGDQVVSTSIGAQSMRILTVTSC